MSTTQILEAAIQAFTRYGFKRTTMADIAEAAGVARQTVYNTFRNKDDIIRSVVRFHSEQTTAAIEAGLANATSLSVRLWVVFRHTVVQPFEQMRHTPNTLELVQGFDEVSHAEIDAAHAKTYQQIDEILSPYSDVLSNRGYTTGELAKFILLSTNGIKTSARGSDEVSKALEVLVTLVERAISTD